MVRQISYTFDRNARLTTNQKGRSGLCNFRRHITAMPSSNEEPFTRIYKKKQWGTEGKGSGPGSAQLQAAGASRILYHVIMMVNATSVIDAPCGAMDWQTPLLNQLIPTVPSFHYLGVDVVADVVSYNQRMFDVQWSLHKNISKVNPGFSVEFVQADLADKNWNVPYGYDLILCRDALQHNTLSDVWRILQRFANSEAKYFLVGSYPEGSMYCRYTRDGSPNINLSHAGGFFCVDLQKPPFNLVPSQIFREATHDRKTLYLFSRLELLSQLQY